MRHAPYHLKVNKAIDRFLLVEILDRLKRHCDLSDYTYYGFGGPFLEDCRLIHDRCPEIQIVSIEKNIATYKRQEFHRFSKNLDLKNKDFASFIADFSSSGREIFWLDYTDLKIGNFDDFKNVLGKVSENSIVKITIRAVPLSKTLPSECRAKKWEDFQEEFGEILPSSKKQKDIETLLPFIKLLQEMLQLASQQEILTSGGSIFHLLNSSYYKDQTQMLSVTGIVCNENNIPKIEQWFKGWTFLNQTWEDSHKIDVPVLSIRERLYLEKHIPTPDKTGDSLSQALGYKIDKTDNENKEKLKQYEVFYKYYPYFARVSI